MEGGKEAKSKRANEKKKAARSRMCILPIRFAKHQPGLSNDLGEKRSISRMQSENIMESSAIKGVGMEVKCSGEATL